LKIPISSPLKPEKLFCPQYLAVMIPEFIRDSLVMAVKQEEAEKS